MDTTSTPHYPILRPFKKLAAGADLVPVYRRLVSDALTPGQRVSQDRRRPLRLPVRERRGRRKSRPLQLPGHRALLRDRSLRQTGDHQRLLGRLGRRNAHAGHPPVRLREPAGRTAAPGRGGPGGALARVAPVLQRCGRLCRLRHGPLLRAPAQRPARRPPGARHGVRLLRPDGRVRQRHEGDRGGGDGPAGQAGRHAGPGLSGGLPPRRPTGRATFFQARPN